VRVVGLRRQPVSQVGGAIAVMKASATATPSLRPSRSFCRQIVIHCTAVITSRWRVPANRGAPENPLTGARVNDNFTPTPRPSSNSARTPRSNHATDR
jgi:hypothetical protein